MIYDRNIQGFQKTIKIELQSFSTLQRMTSLTNLKIDRIIIFLFLKIESSVKELLDELKSTLQWKI